MMKKEVLTLNELDKALSFKTEEEASQYLYEAQLVKEISDRTYENGFADATMAILDSQGMLEKHRKKNMSQYELIGGNIMTESSKKSFDWNKANAVIGVVGGTLSIGIGIYQLISMVKANRAAKQQVLLEAQNEETK